MTHQTHTQNRKHLIKSVREAGRNRERGRERERERGEGERERLEGETGGALCRQILLAGAVFLNCPTYRF